MKHISDWIMRKYFRWRKGRLDMAIANQDQTQAKILRKLLLENRHCEFGMEYKFKEISSYEDYREKVPLQHYDDIFPFIERMMQGEDGILCDQSLRWFARSSGTSTGRSKYIPVTKNYLYEGHLECAWDAACFIYNEDPEAGLFRDKSLIMGGSVDYLGNGCYAGDISGIIIKHFPAVGRYFYTPDFDTALLNDWDQKIKSMAAITSRENVVLVAGVPTWLMVLFKEMLDQTGARNIHEIWPGLRSFLHGGVNFEPYRAQFEELLRNDNIRFREVYNASEGYFAFQNRVGEDGMLLMCNHGIFYEFIPWDGNNLSKENVCALKDLKAGNEYALVISNTSGLYRYIIGDVIKVVSIDPVKIKVTGRIGSMINVFGEEVSVDNTDRALGLVCGKTGARIRDYTVAPVFLDAQSKGAHEWYVEFILRPGDIENFAVLLDAALREINSDYDAKRSYDLALTSLQLKVLPEGSFEKWMRQRGKYGGQNKVPRLSNDRKILDEIDAVM